MSHVFHRQARHHYPVAVRGAGAVIEDSAGKMGQIIGVIDEIAFQTNLLA